MPQAATPPVPAPPTPAPAAPPPPPPPPPPAFAEPEPEAQVPVAAPPPPFEQPPAAEPAAPVSGPVVEPGPPPPLRDEIRPPPPSYVEPSLEDDFAEARSSFDHEPPFRPRRNWARMWTLAALLFAAVSVAAIAAVSWYGLPDWMPMARETFAEAEPDLVLDFPPDKQDRRTLPNGTEYFGASGTITNVGGSRRTVPSLLIVLRGSREQIVYSWEVTPPKRELGPGESVTINEAVTDVPKSAKFAEIGWKPR